jgi:hypothetical protein
MKTANTSNQIQTFRGLSWDESLTQERIRYIEDTFGPLAKNLIELADLVGETMQWHVEPYPDRDLPYKMVKMAAIEIERDKFLSIPCDIYNLVVRVLASTKKLLLKIEMVIGKKQAEEFYYTLVSTFGLVYGETPFGITQQPPNETFLSVGFRVDKFGICKFEDIVAKLKHWHSTFLLMTEFDQKPTDDSGGKVLTLNDLKNPVTCIEVAGIIHKRSDNIAQILKRHHYPVVKSSGKYYCESEHAEVLWPKWKKHCQNKQGP